MQEAMMEMVSKSIKGKAKREYELLEALSLCWSTTTFIISS